MASVLCFGGHDEREQTLKTPLGNGRIRSVHGRRVMAATNQTRRYFGPGVLIVRLWWTNRTWSIAKRFCGYTRAA